MTIPPKEITATSVVPPPISIIKWPDDELIGIPAPIAERTGSLARNTSFAPASIPDSITALFSVEVIPAGTPIKSSGLKNLFIPVLTLVIKCLSIAWVVL